MTKLDFAVFDADNHYYEALDAFTRHIDPAMRKRTMQWAQVGGKTRLLVGGRVNRFIPNPTFEHVAKAGCLVDYFRGEAGVTDMREAFGELEPIEERPEYRDRAARLERMDQQGIEACLILPTLGVGMEAALEHDRPALTAAFTAFNRWLDEDWGFNYRDRIYATPYITLADVDWALEELEYALERDVRAILMRPGPIACTEGRRSLGDPAHDRFWARLNEAGVTLALHGGDSSYGVYEQLWGLSGEAEAFRTPTLKRLLSATPIHDTMASLMADRVLERYPRIRVATIETGSDWVAPLLKKLKTASVQAPDGFGQDPVELFRDRVWVSPYFEDDVEKLAELLGSERVLFGSDFPHAEGLPEPTDFVRDLEGLSDETVRKIMRDNARELVTPLP